MEIRTRRAWSLLIDALMLGGLLAVLYAATTASASVHEEVTEPELASLRLTSDDSGLIALGVNLGEIPLLRR